MSTPNTSTPNTSAPNTSTPTTRTTRTIRQLSDGREIVYYDSTPTAREAIDTRTLADAPTHTELRRDPLLDEWVVVAGHRQARTFLPPTSECPLCPSAGHQLTEIPEKDYEVVVFENRFPSLTSTIAETLSINGTPPDANHPDLRPGFGICEVVCFTSHHGSSLSQVTPDRMRTILDAWMDRDRVLSQREGVEYVFVFENRGVEVGVTLSHPHGQIYAYPFVPPREKQMQANARTYREQTGRSLFQDVIDSEVADQVRMVHKGEHWVGFVPKAARWPFEVQLFPRRKVAHLRDLSEAEQAEFSTAYLSILTSLDAVLDLQMPYIAAWHQAPVRDYHPDSHLFLELFSLKRAKEKLKYLAGSESAAWVWINDIAPEQAAEKLRAGQLGTQHHRAEQQNSPA